MVAIIPCSGYGTRMGMLPHQSKEMMYDKKYNEYVIDYSLDLCYRTGLDPLVISRKDKDDLNSYLIKEGHTPLHIEDGTEWYDSILKSYDYWSDNNIVILPDTRWDNSQRSIEHVKYCLEELNKPMVIGTLSIKDVTKWCLVDNGCLIEKPSGYYGEKTSHLAAGLFSFTKNNGYDLFNSFNRKEYYKMPNNTQFVKLENFHDITREKSDRLVYDIS